MSFIKIKSLKIKNYRSFGNEPQEFDFTKATDKNLPLAIVGYNNAGKTNLMNSILYGVGYNFIAENTFEKRDLFDLKYTNNIIVTSILNGSGYHAINWKGENELKSITGTYTYQTFQEDGELKSKIKPSFFGVNKHYQIFYINFHKIKEEIQTQKTSWGNLRSFLAKHIKKLVDEDEVMKSRKENFKSGVRDATDKVLNGKDGETKSKLIEFIQNIKKNYCTNLRDNNCEVEFGLPDYEDIFLQMVFKIGLNGKADKLVPIDHFGDGYISMFVMAVIQAIAEEKTEDKCLFLFEEPESFLHENHQEYFYKTVLCELAQKGHQVIYTTHSDKMVDITKPDSLIRLKFDGEQTVKAFPAEGIVNPLEKPGDQKIIEQYNQYIKNIEPNLNKILFSEKVLLVEGPNDLLVYNFLIKLKARSIAESDSSIKNKEKWAETYLNFNNVAIIPHHGKATAYILADLCNYYIINDWDFGLDFVDDLKKFTGTEENYTTLTMWHEIKNENNNKDEIYAEKTIKSMITTNKNLIKSAKDDQIHFNVKKLETLINYSSDDKNPIKIWQTIEEKFPTVDKIEKGIFPDTLDKFLFSPKAQENLNQEINTTTKPKENDNFESALAKFNDSQETPEWYSKVDLPF
jgi:predicted ATP-dependent endonuclease of OLD family